jgi:hypothetical protein
VLGVLRRLFDEVRRRQASEAEQLLRLSGEAREAERKPRPLGWTSWPNVSSGGATRAGATMRPPSASRWQ